MANQTLKLKISILTLFPEVLKAYLGSSIIGRALAQGRLEVELVPIRDFATDKYKTVDDAPYGGGDGMLMKADVLYRAWEAVVSKVEIPSENSTQFNQKPGYKSHKSGKNIQTFLLSPQGYLWTQEHAKNLLSESSQSLSTSQVQTHFIFVCGHYEGVDQRFIELCVDQEVSSGNYVLTGGELPALIMVDTLARLIPGVVGKEGSVTTDSLENGLLKYPQYTRPNEFMGLQVPEVLISGNHSVIDQWRRDKALEQTKIKRPDLMLLAQKGPKK